MSADRLRIEDVVLRLVCLDVEHPDSLNLSSEAMDRLVSNSRREETSSCDEQRRCKLLHGFHYF